MKKGAILIIVLVIIALMALYAFYIRSDAHQEKGINNAFNAACDKVDKEGNFKGDEEIDFIECRNYICVMNREYKGDSYNFDCNNRSEGFKKATEVES